MRPEIDVVSCTLCSRFLKLIDQGLESDNNSYIKPGIALELGFFETTVMSDFILWRFLSSGKTLFRLFELLLKVFFNQELLSVDREFLLKRTGCCFGS